MRDLPEGMLGRLLRTCPAANLAEVGGKLADQPCMLGGQGRVAVGCVHSRAIDSALFQHSSVDGEPAGPLHPPLPGLGAWELTGINSEWL